MQIIKANDIRKDFTDIANRVKYAKESYIVTNQNKPSVGIVPIEILQLLAVIKVEATKNKELARALEDYITFIDDEDVKFLADLNNAPKNVNPHLKDAAKSLKGKMQNS